MTSPLFFWSIVLKPPVKIVYLAGPIRGLTHDDARYGWRLEFSLLLSRHSHILCTSPMRDIDEKSPIDESAIVCRDKYDVINSDLVVVNFLGSQIGSLGTAVEFGWADMAEVPIMCIIEENPVTNPHDHPILNKLSGYTAHSLDEAARLTISMLTPGI